MRAGRPRRGWCSLWRGCHSHGPARTLHHTPAGEPAPPRRVASSQVNEPQPADETLRSKFAELYRIGGLELVAAVLVAGVIGLAIAIIDHFRPGFGDRAMRAIERRNPRVRTMRHV